MALQRTVGTEEASIVMAIVFGVATAIIVIITTIIIIIITMKNLSKVEISL